MGPMNSVFAGRFAFPIIVCALLMGAPARGVERVSLAGQWRFALDGADAGVAQRWFERSLEQRVTLPGALQNQGFGEDIRVDTKWTGEVGMEAWLKGPQYAKYRQPGNIKVPFFLQPEKHYVGAAWYQRDVEIPKSWRGKRVVLSLERPHWETRVWVDGRLMGTNTSLSTPHRYDLGTDLAPGKHTVTIRVDNRVIVQVGDWAHSVTDHTQGNWNGVVGDICLYATSPVWIEDVQVYPSVATKSAQVKVQIGNATGQAGSGVLEINGRAQPVAWGENGGAAEADLAMGTDGTQWDEFRPVLQKLRLKLKGGQGEDTRAVQFGLREITTKGKEFMLNGHPAFLRGTLECCIFPLTGYPPTDVEYWKKIIKGKNRKGQHD